MVSPVQANQGRQIRSFFGGVSGNVLAFRAIREYQILGANPSLNTQTLSAEGLDSFIQSRFGIFKSVLLTVQIGLVFMRFFAVAIGFDLRRRGQARDSLARPVPFLDPRIVVGLERIVQAIVPETFDGLCFAFAKAVSRQVAVSSDEIRSRPACLQDSEFSSREIFERQIRMLGINKDCVREKWSAGLRALRQYKRN